MKKSVVIGFSLMCLRLVAEILPGNIVGYSTVTVPLGKSVFSIPAKPVGVPKFTLADILPYANEGDRVQWAGGDACVETVAGEKQWVSNGKIVTSETLDVSSSLTYWNTGTRPIALIFSGKFEVSDAGMDSMSEMTPKSIVGERPVARPMSLADILSYSTVQIKNVEGQRVVSAGTGFFYEIRYKGFWIPIIISNRHVVEGVKESLFVFTLAENDRPLSAHINFKLLYNTVNWIFHPDPQVDLAALPILPILNIMHQKKMKPYLAYLNFSHIPSETDFSGICQLDDVIMIGYPSMLRDEANNQPIFRKGSIATNPNKGFNGNREFLIDMAVYGGSSGSPVLLASDGPYVNRTSNSFVSNGVRLNLLGVNKAVHLTTIDGRLDVECIQTARVNLIPKTSIPNNIGVVIHASRIKELEDHIITFAGFDKK